MRRVWLALAGLLVVCAHSTAVAVPMAAASERTLSLPTLRWQRPHTCQTRDSALCLHVASLAENALLIEAELLRVELERPAEAGRPAPHPLQQAPQLAARAVGGELQFGHGRELSVQLTPTPRRCAPLVKLTF